MGFSCRWSLPLYSGKNLPWIQCAPRSVCPGQSNQPKEVPGFLLHRLLGSWSPGPQAVNRCHRKGKLGLPFGWLTKRRVQDQQPITWYLSKKKGRGMEEKATEERTGTVKFGIRLVCTGDATKIILHQRVCISREPLYMPGKSQIIHVARNSPDQLLFLVSSLYSFKMTHYDARKRTNSFEIKLTWVETLALPLTDRVNCEPNCPHSLSKENWNIQEWEMDHLKFLPETAWAYVLKRILLFGKRPAQWYFKFHRKKIFPPL